jgi:hypothetical protein
VTVPTPDPTTGCPHGQCPKPEPCWGPCEDRKPTPITPDREERGEGEAGQDDRLCGECGAYISAANRPRCHDPIHLQGRLTALAQERDELERDLGNAQAHRRSETTRAESLQARVDELERRIFDGGRELGRNLRESQARVRELEEGVERAMAEVYSQSREAAVVVARVCDEELDRSGALLGRVRKAARLLSHQPEDTAS